jgi:hypothetical protein
VGSVIFRLSPHTPNILFIKEQMASLDFVPQHQALTVHPEVIDEMTGEKVPGSADVVDTKTMNWAADKDRQFPELPEEVEPSEEATFEAPLFETQEEALTQTFEEVYNAEVEYSEEMAGEIANADIGDSEAATTVKYLASQVYLQNMTTEDAFKAAVESGQDPDKLLFAYYNLKSKL